MVDQYKCDISKLDTNSGYMLQMKDASFIPVKSDRSYTSSDCIFLDQIITEHKSIHRIALP